MLLPKEKKNLFKKYNNLKIRNCNETLLKGIRPIFHSLYTETKGGVFINFICRTEHQSC